MSTHRVTRLRLKKREERRLQAGHLWVFSNEIDIDITPIKLIEPGAPVIIESTSGKFLAHAFANPSSLITARVTSRNSSLPFSAVVLRDRLTHALLLREQRFDEPYYRWVNGEGDFLPGLVVDRYGDVLVVQITAAGMECYKADIIDALVSLGSAKAVYLRNDTASRALEQLDLYREWVVGAAPEKLQIIENNLTFSVPAELGQKTGWFYDHRASRLALRNWSSGKRVLDMYTYMGGFGLNAAAAGAASVLAIDSSSPAIAAANDNAELNGFSAVFSAQQGDAVEAMRSLFSDGERFDVIALDPPAFIKRKKDREAGSRHYALNNRLAMRLLKPGGIVLSASCSQALDLHSLQQTLRQNIPKASLGLQVLNTFQQAADHPVNAAMPETLYLKGLIARLP